MTRARQPFGTLRHDAREMVVTCAACNCRLAARRLTQFFDRGMAETGLSVAQLGLMARIASAEDDSMAALARDGGLEQSTLSRNLRTLEAMGLVEIAMVETDLRRRAVWLTESGARRLSAAIPLWRAANARLARLLASGLARRLAEATDSLPAD
jgi:DNA-binding MarR family transcriptional regulator